MSETRQEAYLAYLAGDTDVTLPEPVTQLEKYWHDIAERVSGAVDAPTGTIELVENGEYSVAEYATAKVNVPEGDYERLTNAQIDTSGQIAYVDFSGSSSLSSFFVVTGESSKQGVVEVGDVLQIGLNKELFGDADDAQVVSGVTYTSKNGLKRTGSHVCSGGILVGGELLLDITVTTTPDPDSYNIPLYETTESFFSYLHDGDVIGVDHNGKVHVLVCKMDTNEDGDPAIYLGNISIMGKPMLEGICAEYGMTVEQFLEQSPEFAELLVDTGESFCIVLEESVMSVATEEAGSQHFVISLLASGGGSAPKLQNKTITENGTYSADEGYDGPGTVEVNVKGGGTLEGLTNGYDVMFYDENNDGLAFFSIKQGHTITAPVYDCKAWKTEDGAIISFPYTPTNDIVLYANNDTIASSLYEHYGVDPGEYPYLAISLDDSDKYNLKIVFSKSVSGATMSNCLQSGMSGGGSFSGGKDVDSMVSYVKSTLTKVNPNSSTSLYTGSRTYNYTNFDLSTTGTLYRLDA